MPPEDLAAELGVTGKRLRDWLRATYRRPTHLSRSRWSLSEEQQAAARAHFGSHARAVTTSTVRRPPSAAPVTPTKNERSRGRHGSDEAYVIDLCDELLGETAKRQHRFPWLLGDPGKRGVRARLRVDAFYERHRLVIEYMERQHDEATPFFDNADTLSGVGRGEQRRIYDRRRAEEIPQHGLRLLLIRPGQLDSNSRGRLRRNIERDRAVLAALLTPPNIGIG